MRAADADAIEALRSSDEPSIRWKVLVGVLGEDRGSKPVRDLEEEIRRAPRTRALLARHGPDGCIRTGRNVYDKWQGAHRVLAALADLGYPAGDAALAPARDQVLEYWLQDCFFQETTWTGAGRARSA